MVASAIYSLEELLDIDYWEEHVWKVSMGITSSSASRPFSRAWGICEGNNSASSQQVILLTKITKFIVLYLTVLPLFFNPDTSIVPPIIYALMGTSRDLVIGAVRSCGFSAFIFNDFKIASWDWFHQLQKDCFHYNFLCWNFSNWFSGN